MQLKKTERVKKNNLRAEVDVIRNRLHDLGPVAPETLNFNLSLAAPSPVSAEPGLNKSCL